MSYRNYEERRNQRIFRLEVEDALCAVNRGNIRCFEFVRRLQKPSGEFHFYSDEGVVHRACHYLGYPVTKLEEWRSQYDTLINESTQPKE